jgi:hypothetical protein
MNAKSAQIATICECIDHCFAFAMWCEEFAKLIPPEDMVAGLDRAVETISDATRLQSFLALRKLDDFFGGVKPKPDDLTAAGLGIDAAAILGGPDKKFLSTDERDDINKGSAHLTERLSLDAESEVDLQATIRRSAPMLEKLVAALCAADTAKEATHWLDRTEALIKRASAS